jgi:hypothetical protein
MIANFALSLSRDGIDLLHLAAHGWRRVGRVDVASETLDEALADLRAKALEMAPDDFATKVIIPPDQIKFLTLDKPDASAAEVHAILEGATPYSLFDIVVDQISMGGKTYIAAVARETLAGAESFADGHGFRPVAFVANPLNESISKEFFFGPSEVMAELVGPGVEIMRGTPAVVSGTNLKLAASAAVEGKDSGETLDALVEPEAKDAPEAGAPVQPAPIVVAELAYFDPVIPEVQATRAPEPPAKPAPSSVPKPQLVAAPKASAPAGTKDAGSAPIRQAAEPNRSRGITWQVAAGIAAVAVIGGGIFAFTGRNATDTRVTPDTGRSAPAAAAVEPPATLQAAPEISAIDVASFGASLPSNDLPESAGPADRPLSDPTPPALAIATADPLPIPPLAPPPLPAQSVSGNDALARAGTVGTVPTPDEARAFYEATGVWLRAPRFFEEPSGAMTLGFARPEVTQTYTALRQPPLLDASEIPEAVFGTPVNPPPPEAVFARDERGFILATPEGAVTPEGAIVFAGRPDLTIVLRPPLSEDDLARMALLAPAPEGVVLATGVPDVLPAPRPDDLVPEELLAETEAPQPQNPVPPGSVGLAGLELQESGSLALDSIVVEQASENDPRPQLRPGGLAPVQTGAPQNLNDILAGVVAADATLRFDSSTALAVATSRRPETRPSGFGDEIASSLAQRAAATLVAAAEAFELEDEPEVEASAPLNIQPIPGDVARAATIEDAISLREINLIGIYGRPNERRALVRLSNGRYVRVQVGSELDGGQVVAIGDDALNYVKRGRTYAIVMPEG